jgi:hypothetical protein
MSRSKLARTAADVAAAIEQLKQKNAEQLASLERRRQALIAQEDQLRGEILRHALMRTELGAARDQLQAALAATLDARQLALFEPSRF